MGKPGGALRIEQFPGGHSNLTYLVRVGDRDWVLRRPPFGTKVKTAHDMGREYRILSKLSTVYPPAPRPILYCDDTSVLGAPFYLMERIRGVIIRKEVPEGVSLTPGLLSRMGEALIDNLAVLHLLDYKAVGLGELGRPDGYVERQVTGWSKRYVDSQTDAIPEIDETAEWLAKNRPPESGTGIIHNDYKYDNLVLDPADLTRIIGVLDWEMSTVGDPWMDLGTTLSYWVQADDDEPLKAIGFGPTHLPGNPTRKELAERYALKTGRAVTNLPFYYCFALFKTAVVLQQIYYRYKQGLTKDERFSMFIMGVQVLAHAAQRVAETGKV